MVGRRSRGILVALLLLGGGGLRAHGQSPAVSAPVLKWQRGGCTVSGCDTGWYASPAVADLDGDGQPDVIWGSYDVVALDGANGSLEWRAPGGNRVWPGVAVADLTGDGTLEVIVGRGGDEVTVYDRNGNLVWTRHPFGSGEVRTLAVDDLESDGQLEIVVGRASGGSTKQLSVYEPDGNVRPGWPARHDGEPGYGWGMYNENVTVADLDGDGFKEILGPTDTHYITALDRNGNQLPTNSIYNGFNPVGPKVWSQVGVHVDQAFDLRGYADCDSASPLINNLRPNFANSAPVIADVNGDGQAEIVVVGNVYDCSIGNDISGDLYLMPWILNLDRTRWASSGFDWTTIPSPGPNTRPLSEDYTVIQSSVANAVVADLDGDGFKEILFPSYDGKVHAYWLDKTEHGNWPYVVPGSGLRFAGEPIVTDLNNDGQAEVIFTSWPENGGGRVGQLHILDSLGNPLYVVDLPAPFGDTWNGGLGAPTIANIDSDPDLELVVGTVSSGVVAYDLPNTANARILWGTGRGSFRRTGAVPASVPTVAIDDPSLAEGNAGITLFGFTVTLSSASAQTVTVAYQTQNGTAAAPTDYAAKSGTVSFAPGQRTRRIVVAVTGDTAIEPSETFSVTLGSPANATLAKDTGVATILNDDPATAASLIDMYRLYADNLTFEHLYTTDLNEYTVLGSGYNSVTHVGWLQEGIAYKLLAGGGSYNGAFGIPLYRLYNTVLRQHHWTTDANEASVLSGQADWNYEGIVGYLLPQPTTATGVTPLYRLWDTGALHLWTTDLNEKNVLSTQRGWIYEGIIGNVVP
jgi:hypothetical protein